MKEEASGEEREIEGVTEQLKKRRQEILLKPRRRQENPSRPLKKS